MGLHPPKHRNTLRNNIENLRKILIGSKLDLIHFMLLFYQCHTFINTPANFLLIYLHFILLTCFNEYSN